MPEMQGLEKRVLQSGAWKRLTQNVTVPWVLGSEQWAASADVLEVGSGGGFNAEVFADRFPAWRVTASDYDQDMVERARARLARFGDRVRVEQADACNLAFPDDSFDVVISILVWHHVGNWRKATAECARVLRPGGRLLLADVTSAFFPQFIAKKLPPMSHYPTRAVRPALDLAGFSRWRISTVGPFLYRAIACTST